MLLVLSVAVSAVLLLLPAFFLSWFWPGVPSGQTCDIVHQPWCRSGHGLPQWYAVAAAIVVTVGLHWAAAVRWPRPSARKLSLLGLTAAVVALALVVLAPALDGLLPDWWFT